MQTTSLDAIVKSVSTSLSRGSDNTLDECGLKSVKNGGSFASVVAYHEDAPDVVIKVVPEHDYFLVFAQAVMKGELVSIHFPKVYAITKVNENYIVLMERLEENNNRKGIELTGDYGDLVYRIERGFWEDDDPESLIDARNQIIKFIDETPLRSLQNDFHCGNFMKRQDGTLVFSDPVWNRAKSLGDCLEKLANQGEGHADAC